MTDINSIFKNTRAKIEEEKLETARQKEKSRQEDEKLIQRISSALAKLSEIATAALEPSSEFSEFMFERVETDPYTPWMARIIVANFPALNNAIDPQNKMFFRIHILGEKKQRKPSTITDFKSFKIACGYWRFCRGLLRVDEDIPVSLDLLHFIEKIDSVESFVEVCTRTNTY